MIPEITASGYVFLPISLSILFFRPRWLLAGAILSSCFIPMTVLNFTGGSFELGLSLWYWIGLLIASREFLIFVAGRANYDRRISVPVFAFMTYTVATAFLFSILFSGIPIYSPRDGLEGAALNQTPLAWSMSNLGQIGYLMIGCAVVLCAHRTRADLTKPLKYLIRIFSFFFVWQIISKTTGLYYPDDILYSNPVYAFGADQTLGDGIPRINSTFNEPSNAGMFLSAFLAVYLFQGRWLSLILCVLGLLITTSSIGYAMLAAVFGFYSLRSSLGALRRGRINIFLVVQLFGLVVLALVLTTYADELLRLVIFEKSDSGSFITRIGADLRALEIFTETYGLGVGLGSNRPSSFLTYMLSNLGFIGVFLFIRMIYKMIKLEQNKQHTGAQLVLTYVFAKILGGARPGRSGPLVVHCGSRVVSSPGCNKTCQRTS